MPEQISRYPIFFEETFLQEGYFQNDPNDKGNYYDGELYGTICGITARDYFREYQTAKQLYDMKNYSLLKDYAMKFYQKKGFWKEGFDQLADSSLAFKVWDVGVNAGPKRSITLLQQTLNKYYDTTILENGDLDNITIMETNGAYVKPTKYTDLKDVEWIEGESILYSLYIYELKMWYKGRKNFWRFGKGWFNRLAKIMNKAPDRIELAIETKSSEKIKNIT